jgi:hypothetical protein
MRPILRSVSNEAKQRAEPPARPEPVAAPEPTAHLGHCWHCGALNGQSASVCWSCEASLRIVAAEPFAPRVEPIPAKPEESAPAAFTTGNEATIPSARAPREAREHRELREHLEHHEPDPEPDRRAVPLLTIPVDMASEYPGPGQFTVVSPARRRGWLFPALIAGLLVLVGGGGWLIFAGAAHDAQEATATSAAVLRAPPMAPIPDAPPAVPASPAQPLETFGVDTAPPVAAPQAFNPVAPADAAPRPNPVRLPKAAQSQRGRGRIAAPDPVVSAQPPPARPAAPVGPCTPTVAALGLCASPSN